MQTDVLIVGAGPSGLAHACQLVRFGIDIFIIDVNEMTTRRNRKGLAYIRRRLIYEQIRLADKVDRGATQ